MAIATESSNTSSPQVGRTPYHRAQILLEAEQHAALKAMSEREGRSISEIVREMVQAGLDAREARVKRRLAVLGELDELRNKIREESGVYLGEDPIELVRRESVEHIDRMLRRLECSAHHASQATRLSRGGNGARVWRKSPLEVPGPQDRARHLE